METRKKKLTIDDVAEALGLSKTTISRAISGKGRIGKATRERVLEFIRENDYSPSVVAKGLSQSKTYNIGILLPPDCNLTELPFFQSCLMGACEMAASADYDMLVSAVPENDISQLVRVVTNQKVDGIILTRTLEKDLASEYLLEKGLPFVAIGTLEDPRVIQVDSDHRKACRELTSLLLRQGSRRIALIGGNRAHMVTKSRYSGYQDALLENGVEEDGGLVFLGVSSRVLVEQAVNGALQGRADCIVCMDDLLCSQALAKLEQDGIAVPEDIRIASFYNSAYLENHVPSITSLNFDAKEAGVQACRILMDKIAGKEVPSRTLLDHEIVLKNSTGTL